MIHLLLSDKASCEKEGYWLTNPIFDKITFLICPWCMWNRQMIPNFFPRYIMHWLGSHVAK